MNSEQIEINSPEPEISESAKRAKSTIKFTRVLLLFAMVIFTASLLFANRDKINTDNFKRLAAKLDMGISITSNPDSAFIDYDYDLTAKIKTYKDGIVRVTAEDLVITDNIGTRFLTTLTGFNNPQVVTTSKYVCAFDRGGKRLIVTNSFDVVFDTTLEQNIVNVSMNDNGYIAVVTESEAYKNHLIVFNSSFKEIYKLNSMNRYFVCADISPDNKSIVVSSLYVKDDNVTPQINCYSLSKEKPVWTAEFEGNVAVDINKKPNGTTVALFDWGVCVLDKNGKENYRYNLQNNILQCYDIANDKYNVVVTSASHDGVSTITVFNSGGKQVLQKDLKQSVKSVNLRFNRIALLSATDIDVLNIRGKQISQTANSNDALAVMLTDKDAVVSVSASSTVYSQIN